MTCAHRNEGRGTTPFDSKLAKRAAQTLTVPNEFVTLARVAKTQGRRGEIAAEVLTDFPEKFADRKRLFARMKDGSHRELRVEDHWPHKGYIVFKFAEIDSINDAEVLIGCELQIPIAERAALEEGAIYVGDLVGCDLIEVSKGERRLGVIKGVDPTSGEAPNLVVETNGKERLIPFAAPYIRKLNLEAKRLEMALPEGLLDIDAPLTEEEKRQQL
jgi:16S rRNA processing protein RimM